MIMGDTIERSQIHAAFVIERSYPAPIEAVWHALSDNDAPDQWFSAGSAFDAHEKSHEAAGFFRVTRWAIDAEAWRQRLGFKGGEQNTNSDVIAETFQA